MLRHKGALILPSSFLQTIAAGRRSDPLAPVTVVVPSHVAGIQLRRRLAAEHGAFAAVRFETLPRLAELLGAGDLARDDKSPLARPIGDYLASQVAHEARGGLAGVRHLPGFARVLRQTFRRLRRGGYKPGDQIPVFAFGSPLLQETVRLYGLFLQASGAFYDDEDAADAAASRVAAAPAVFAAEFGDVYILSPAALSAGSLRLLEAMKRAVGRGRYHEVPDETPAQEARLILAPDPASEAREVVREVIDALRNGTGLHEVAVFHGADSAYRDLLTQAFRTAGVPVNALPGVPLSETAAGRGVLMLAELPLHNYARTEVIDWLSLAPLQVRLPGGSEPVLALPAPWRRLAREAGVTQGADRWRTGLDALISDLDSKLAQTEEDSPRRLHYQEQQARASDLQTLIESLVARLEPLRTPQPATAFIAAFRQIVASYLDPEAPAYDAVIGQIDQLGTIDKVGGRFTLESFAGALRANLDAAHQREGVLGDGVLVAHYRVAAALSFKHTVLCGAYEGVFPAGPPAEPLVDDGIWRDLRGSHPMIDDSAHRLERARAEARRAAASAAERITWTAPMQAAGAGREHYPAQAMLTAARALDASIASASDLRRANARPWLRKPASPTSALLTGTPVDVAELRVRASVAARRDATPIAPDHALAPALNLLAARKGDDFSAYDGNLSALAGERLIPTGSVSPTSLENYAACGFRYFLGNVLRLRPPEEPEDRDTMDAAERGTLVHETLQEFFKRQHGRGRPAAGEPWNDADRTELLDILDTHLAAARERGRTGLDVYAERERRRLRADMSNFLDHDSLFRATTGAVPSDFEKSLPLDPDAAVPMRGFVDRIDRTPDGEKAWIIDYKTGSASAYEAIKKDDPLAGGTKLQLPAYMAAASDAETITPLYWFISAAGKFARIDFQATEENMQRYRGTLEAIVSGVRGGIFPAVPGEENTRFGGWDNCRFCDFDRLCGRRRDDELFAKRHDPALRPWQSVAETARGEPR